MRHKNINGSWPYGGVGSGKDFVAWNLSIRAAIRQPGVYYIIYPTYAQGKKILWDSVLNTTGERFIDLIPKELITSLNAHEMKIRLVNDSLIQVIGSDNPDSIVGTNPIGCIFSEYALQDPRVYALIRPILAANGGWCFFISTPRSKNHFWELYNIAKFNPSEWFVSYLTLDDTQHIPLHEIERDRHEGLMSEDLILQEYYCSWTCGQAGAYYAKYVDKMRLNGQIGAVPWEAAFPVHSAWDIGVRDSTSIIMFQTIGQVVRIIDYYENSKEGLEHYTNVLQQKPYQWGKHFGPHDIKVKEFGSGLTRVEKAKQLGIKFTLAPNISIEDGIEAVRSSFSKMWIDETKCARLIKAVENYRQEWDDQKKVYKPMPLHNEYSHSCDALRYLCLSLPKIRDGLTPEKIEQFRREALYGPQDLPTFYRDDVFNG